MLSYKRLKQTHHRLNNCERDGGRVPTIDAANDTHIVLGILVGAGVDQHPRAVHVTVHSGANQRRAPPLQR